MKSKNGLDQMLAYVEEHSSWLSSSDYSWFQKLKNYYSEKQFLSAAQSAILKKIVSKIHYHLRHQQKVMNTKRVSYQKH